MRRALILGLVAVNIGVAVLSVNWAQALLQDTGDPQTAQAEASLPNQTQSNAQPAGQTLTRYAAAPLFHKDRAFAAPPQAPVMAMANASSPPRAVGTILSNTADKWVLLVHPDTQATQKAALGESFAGWDVKAITETSVQLQRKDTVLTKPIRP